MGALLSREASEDHIQSLALDTRSIAHLGAPTNHRQQSNAIRATRHTPKPSSAGSLLREPTSTPRRSERLLKRTPLDASNTKKTSTRGGRSDPIENISGPSNNTGKRMRTNDAHHESHTQTPAPKRPNHNVPAEVENSMSTPPPASIDDGAIPDEVDTDDQTTVREESRRILDRISAMHNISSSNLT